MRAHTLHAALIWLTALVFAAQACGAPALLDSCHCQACHCGEQLEQSSCCELPAAMVGKASCGQSCCQTAAGNCSQTPHPFGCCCVDAEPNVPASLSKSDKPNPEKPLSQVISAPKIDIVKHSIPSVILLTGIRHESPPPRILYCVWLI